MKSCFLFSNRKLSLKKLSLCHKSQFSNTYISTTKLCKPLIFQTYIVWYNRSHTLKYLRSISLDCWDIGYKIQSLWKNSIPYDIFHCTDWTVKIQKNILQRNCAICPEFVCLCPKNFLAAEQSDKFFHSNSYEPRKRLWLVRIKRFA